MFSLLRRFVRAFWSAFTSRRDLALRSIALEHQLDVVTRPASRRPRLTRTDRILWVWLSRIWSGWKDAVRIVKPETRSSAGIAAAGGSTGPGGASAAARGDRPFRRTSAT